MKPHRKWTAFLSYFKKPENYKNEIDSLLSEDKNVLLMIKKEEGTGHELQKEKFDKLCELYSKETKDGKIIISAVPDIESIKEIEK